MRGFEEAPARGEPAIRTENWLDAATLQGSGHDSVAGQLFRNTCSPGPRAAPSNKVAFSALMAVAASCNRTLLEYVYPAPSLVRDDVSLNWTPQTGCAIAKDCYCFHVEGDMSRAANPDGWKKCARISKIETCERPNDKRSCCCLHGQRCLFSDMRPTKILAVIAAARAAGVTRIVEEGRFGGLSAYMYHLHGFEVVSVEFLPLSGATAALRERAPAIELVEGDGAKLLPTLLTPKDAARTAVIFDGEKRLGAWQTFAKVRANVALAVFDDTNIGSDGEPFKRMLDEQKEVWWDTTDASWSPLIGREQGPLSLLDPLREPASGCSNWHGGLADLQDFHFSIVRGGAWAGERAYTTEWAANHSSVRRYNRHAGVREQLLRPAGSV